MRTGLQGKLQLGADPLNQVVQGHSPLITTEHTNWAGEFHGPFFTKAVTESHRHLAWGTRRTIQLNEKYEFNTHVWGQAYEAPGHGE